MVVVTEIVLVDVELVDEDELIDEDDVVTVVVVVVIVVIVVVVVARKEKSIKLFAREKPRHESLLVVMVVLLPLRIMRIPISNAKLINNNAVQRPASKQQHGVQQGQHQVKNAPR